MNQTDASRRNEDFVKIDPSSIQEALRLFFQPTRTGDSRTDFYSAYQSEATEYDKRFVKQYDAYLDTSLIFAGLFSAVCAAFVIDRQQKLEPDPVVYLQAILQALENQTAILKTLQRSNSTAEPVSSHPWVGPSSAQATVSTLLYASLCTSLLAAFLAMLGKHWLHRYARHSGNSIAKRCKDRQVKLDGIERWSLRIIVETPSVLLQLSLLLLVVGFSRYLWDAGHRTSLVIITFTAAVALSYAAIVFIGTLSYEFPFQTPPSFVLRYFGINRLIERPVSKFFSRPTRKSSPGASCVLWALNHIADPEVTVPTLGHMANIRWFFNPPERAPLLQVAGIYMGCFDANNHIVLERREMARVASRVLIQLYVHRMCLGGNSNNDLVTNALNRLQADGQLDQDLQRLSPVAKSILRPDRGPGVPWEMTHFDLPWISELWMYRVWFLRTENQPARIVAEQSFLGTITKLFSRKKSPPLNVVRNVLHGILAGVSSRAFELDEFLDLQRNGSVENLLMRLREEMVDLARNRRDLGIPWATLGALVSWEHGLIELTILCCDLLPHVMDDLFFARKLCLIAFRHHIPNAKTYTNLLDLEALKRLLGNDYRSVEVDNDLASSFASVSWNDESGHYILETIVGRKHAAGLSPSSLATIITAIGKARFSLVERFNHEVLANFVRGLSTDAIQRIVTNTSVCVGWIRLLLWFTFPHLRSETDTRSFWKALRSILHHGPDFFSLGLPNSLGPFEIILLYPSEAPSLYSSKAPSPIPSEAPLPGHSGVPLPPSKAPSPDPSEAPPPDPNENNQITRRQTEEALWMKFFWSSRAFEEDSYEAQWSMFSATTGRLMEEKPEFFEQLQGLCKQAETTAEETNTYSKMKKLGGAIRPPSPTHRRNGTLPQDQIISNTTSSGPPPPMIQSPPGATPRDIPLTSPMRQRSSTLFQEQDRLPLSTTSSEPLLPLFRSASFQATKLPRGRIKGQTSGRSYDTL